MLRFEFLCSSCARALPRKIPTLNRWQQRKAFDDVDDIRVLPMYTANCSNASRLLCPTTIVSCRVLPCMRIVLFYAASSVAPPPSIPPSITHVLVSRIGSALDMSTYERLLRPSIFIPSPSILSFLHVSPRRPDLVLFSPSSLF